MPALVPVPPAIHSAVNSFASQLAQTAVDSPRLSAEVLLAHVLGVDRLRLLVDRNMLLTPEQYAQAHALVLRRAQGEPVAYLTGNREFYGRAFAVTPDTLIPRPETELLIDTACKEHSAQPSSLPLYFADLGTGSGCIAVTMAAEHAHAHGVAVDINAKALSVARTNAHTHGVAQRLTFLQADFSTHIFAPASFHMILANPPYVSALEYDTLDHEVRNYEPKIALVPRAAHASGLEDACQILDLASTWLKPGGLLLMEIGCHQGKALLDAVKSRSSHWDTARIIPDLARRDRVLHARCST